MFRKEVPKVRVEVKVAGMIGARFIAVAETVEIPDGASPKDAVTALHRAGAIDREVYRAIKGLRPPFFVAVNDVKPEGAPGPIALHDGDRLSILQIAAGG